MAVAFPLKPPRDWFDLPEAETATPLTFEKNGRVYGHIALWGSCHTGFLNGAMAECVQPPPSRNDYQSFHLGVIETQEGQDVRVGKITYNTGHAPLAATAGATVKHYDDTGAVGAFVRARNGSLGIWVAGAVRSDITPEGFRDLRANPPSGDWRRIDRGLELVAALAVPVPGFPVSRAQLSLSASAGEPEVETLILPAWEPEAAEFDDAHYQQRQAILASAGFGNGRDSKEYRRKIRALTRV
jgi:hypothetical protein